VVNTRVDTFWLRLTVWGALGVTAVDAVLLQKSRSFFTGGFLAPVHTSGPWEGLGFLAMAAIADAGIVGALAAAGVAIASRRRLTQLARSAAVLLAAVGPLLLVNVVNYRLLTYFGDRFDLSLMFDLTGRRPGEIVAVASTQLLQIGLLVVVPAVALVAFVWLLNRYGGGARATRTPSRSALLAAPLVLFLVSMLSTSLVSASSETFEDGLRRTPSGRLYELVISRLSDVDGDGFGVLGRIKDPAIFDGKVYPWAPDLPGNGVDEDGIGGDLPPEADKYREAERPATAWRKRPDVVLFVLESFRADAVGRRINGLPVTPALDALAAEGVSSSAAYSHNGYTAQSRFHLLSGSLAGLRNGTSLIDDFARNGYETAYFSAQDESFGGEALGVGFERASTSYDARRDRDRRYSTFTTAGSLAVSYKTLEERLAAFLADRDRTRPLFLYVNFHDTHYPYHHDQILPLVSTSVLSTSQIAPANATALQQMYFNTAANVDRAVGWVVEKTAASLGRVPAVLVTADHGESLFDEGFVGHGYDLNEVQTRVPLIVRGLPLTIEEPFGQSDLRNAIDAALSGDASDAKPRVVRPEGKVVFQYLGNIDRPRQIGLLTGSTRLIYDFREHRVQTSRVRTWRRIGDLGAEEYTLFQQLLWSWEGMILARRGQP
jgi:hypothetical protein